jgi:hypothetical protein
MLRKFRNHSESRIQKQILAVIGRHGAELHEKVRVADIINIEMLSQRELGTYALQSHFDFVLIDKSQKAIVAIEFDGFGHSTSNDTKKNLICKQANLPMFRVYAFEEMREINKMALTSYLVELVFHAQLFQELKARGEISQSEPFMLSGFISKDAKSIFESEFNFLGNANHKLTQTLKKSNLDNHDFPHLSINRLVVQSADGDLRGFASIESIKGTIIATSKARISLASAGFLAEIATIPMEIAQFVDGMACEQLLENIRLIGTGAGHVVRTVDEVLQDLRNLANQGYEVVFSTGCSNSNIDLNAAFTNCSI